jgi:hypothetical protein
MNQKLESEKDKRLDELTNFAEIKKRVIIRKQYFLELRNEEAAE